MNRNICKFVSTQKPDDSINIINFVYEKEAVFKQSYLIPSTYSLALVTGGSGILHTPMGDFVLGTGALFLTFPAKAYYVENTGDLRYIYISFTGLRALALMQRLKLSAAAPVLPGFAFLIDTWEGYFEASNDKNADLFCEGLILLTLGFLCSDKEEKDYDRKASDLLLAKQYVDLHYTDCDLDLKSVSERFSYNPKYFSTAFKKMVRVNFSEYLKLKRLSYAVSLIEIGITNASELAELCGYRDPLYFSKSFKKQYGVSPKQWSSKKSEES